MDISDKETEELYEWGVKFFEMGFDACLKHISKTGSFAKKAKTEAVKEFISQQKNSANSPIPDVFACGVCKSEYESAYLASEC